MLIMHIILFSLSHKNCGCYVAPVGDLSVVGNTCAC